MFWFFAGLVFVGLIVFPVLFFTVRKWLKTKQVLYLISGCILVIAAIIFIYVCFELNHKNLSDFRYETTYEELQTEVEVKEVTNDKGKEKEYIVWTHGDKTTIKESVYKKYIGDERKVSIQYASVSLYVGHTYPFGKPTSFSGEEMELEYIYEDRFSWPWEEKVEAYTNEDIKELAESYLDGEIETNGVTHIDVSKNTKVIE